MDNKKRFRPKLWRKRNPGQSLVEFALVLPLLALLLFAIIQYGFIFAAYITLRNASAVAARYATLGTVPPPTVPQVQAVARGAIGPMLQTNNIVAVNVELNAQVGGVGGAKSVQIVYNLPLIVRFVVPGATGNTLQLSATTVAR